MTEEEHRKLSDTKAERRLEIALAKDTVELQGGQPSGSSSARSSVNQLTPSSRQSRADSPNSGPVMKMGLNIGINLYTVCFLGSQLSIL